MSQPLIDEVKRETAFLSNEFPVTYALILRLIDLAQAQQIELDALRPKEKNSSRTTDLIRLRFREQRFIPSRFHCPQCGGAVLTDNFPPNYGGGVWHIDQSSEDSGSLKQVCEHCRISFVVIWFYYGYEGDQPNYAPELEPYITARHSVGTRTLVEGHYVINVRPLFERDGWWLTNWDVEHYDDPPGIVYSW